MKLELELQALSKVYQDMRRNEYTMTYLQNILNANHFSDEVWKGRGKDAYQFIINDPISIPPIGILALPGDAAPQPWLTNAVLHHLQTQTESSYAEEEHEHL